MASAGIEKISIITNTNTSTIIKTQISMFEISPLFDKKNSVFDFIVTNSNNITVWITNKVKCKKNENINNPVVCLVIHNMTISKQRMENIL